MKSLIVVSYNFERHWSWSADYWEMQWQHQGETELIRLDADDTRGLGEIAAERSIDLTAVERLAAVDVPVSKTTLQLMTQLQEAAFPNVYRGNHLDDEAQAYLADKQVSVYEHLSEGFWGQSVSEFALALTFCGLRRIPQNYHEMLTSHEAWTRYSPKLAPQPSRLAAQFSDDIDFTCGTLHGKRVRVVGMGNIGSRYASFASMLGADVAAFDPFAAEAHFHRTGVRKEWRLEELVKDAEIFVPMLPLTEATRGVVTAEHINALPKGCLVILATRAKICDVDAIRRRVLADEFALAADVFDVEPVPLDDPLLGRHNVVHTPHLAGRTKEANREWVDALLVQFRNA